MSEYKAEYDKAVAEGFEGNFELWATRIHHATVQGGSIRFENAARCVVYSNDGGEIYYSAPNRLKGFIPPHEVAEMDKDESVKVSRIAINRQNVSLCQNPNYDEETGKKRRIINNAARGLNVKIPREDKELEKKLGSRRVALWGADMKVEDVVEAFDDIETMPFNSFREADNKSQNAL